MTPRQQIKSLSVTSNPITAGLNQKTDMPVTVPYDIAAITP